MTRLAAIIRFALSLAVVAGAGGCYDPHLVTPPDDVLSLTVSPGTIPADGFSTAQVVAHVNPASRSSLKITFTTSVSSLTIPNGQNRAVDSNGDVTVLLTSDTTPKTVLVTAEAKDGSDVLASRSVAVVFQPASASSVIKLTASSSQLDADGASSVIMRAEINPALSSRVVTFKTTNGSFTRDTNLTEMPVTAGADGVATAPLYASSSLGSAVVTATSNGFSASQTVTFVAALPDFMTLTANPLSVSKATDTNFTAVAATLSRSLGSVTGSTRVDFSIANDTTSESFGRFESTSRTSDSGQVTVSVKFFPSTSAPLGLATITARVPDNGLTAHVKINVVP